MFKGLEHTAIASPDPEKLARWYVDHLGFAINYTYAGNYFVKAANGTVSFNRKAIEPANSPKPPEPAQGSPNGPPPPVTFDGGTWDGTGFHSSGSANALGDFFYKLTFTKAGTYKYECLIHPDMLGTVKVG